MEARTMGFIVDDLLIALGVVAVSVPLFLYWLWMMHTMIVNDDAVLQHADRVAAMIQLRYPEALRFPQNPQALVGDRLFQDLLEDFKLVRSIIADGPPVEFQIAVLGFTGARWCHRVSKALDLPQATRAHALIVMATSVRYFAGVAGLTR